MIILKNINWAAISSVAASISALLSLISIFINTHYSRKNYKANLKINSKLELLKTVRKLVPDYITEVNATLYSYMKGWSNENDKKAKAENLLPPNIIMGETGLEDYDSRLTKAKIVYHELKTTLQIYENQQLLKDVELVWSILDKKNRDIIASVATNRGISPEEEKINSDFEKVSNKLTEDFTKWYNDEFQKLTK